MSARIVFTRFKSRINFSKHAVVLRGFWKSGGLSYQVCRTLHVDTPPCIPTVTTSYVHGTSTISLLSCTVPQALQATVDRWPDREAVVFMKDGIRKTFAQFQQDVDQAAAGLLALGLKRGDKLGMWGPNIYEWILFQFATAKAGIVLVSVNPAYQLQEVEFALRKVQCNAVVCPTQFKTQKYYEMLKKICPEMETARQGIFKSARLPDMRMVVLTDSRQPGALHMDDVFQAGGSEELKELESLQKKLSCDDPINIQFTSGTTGNPKGATLSHHNIINNSYFIGRRLGFDWRPQVRVCVPVPLYHTFGAVGGGMCMAVHGVTLVFPSPGYDGRANLEAIEKESVCTDGDVSLLIVCVCQIAYGTTENSPVTFLSFPRDNLELKTKTVGCVMPHVEAKIINPVSGEVVRLGEPGELLVRGYCVMLEYYNDDAKTQEVIGKDRWYRTGDIASMDQFGYCRIEGRMKDMIIRGGENIYPAEIEQFLHKHPKVQEAQKNKLRAQMEKKLEL
nr:acyl-CoA synthetase family member 2, mitochondrial-like [Paramormyrops kingsleyae]